MHEREQPESYHYPSAMLNESTISNIICDESLRSNLNEYQNKFINHPNLYVLAEHSALATPKCGTLNCDGKGNVNANRTRHYT